MDNLTSTELDRYSLDDNDKVLGALCYPGFLSVIVPLIILLSQPKTSLKFHALHGIALHLGFIIGWTLLFFLSFFLFFITFGMGNLITVPLLILLMFGYLGISTYWGYKIYSGENVNIPCITEFVLKNIIKN